MLKARAKVVKAGPGVAESIAFVAGWWFHPTVDLIGNTYTDCTQFTVRCRDKHDGFRFLDNIDIILSIFPPIIQMSRMDSRMS